MPFPARQRTCIGLIEQQHRFAGGYAARCFVKVAAGGYAPAAHSMEHGLKMIMGPIGLFGEVVKSQ